MPLNALTTFLGAIVMFGAYALINIRLRSNGNTASYQARQLQFYFLFLGFFYITICSPYLLLVNQPEKFSSAMAVAYVVSHVFMYIGFIFMMRLLFSMIPRISSKVNIAVVIASISIVAITILNAVTMIWGTQPVYDAANGITKFNAHPAVGAYIGLFGVLTSLPTVILFIVNGFHNPSARTRSWLLAFGLLVVLVAGPLHDVARNNTMYAMADVFSIVGLIITAGGVLYRIDERITVPAGSTVQTVSR
jgi:hypothetical protein